MQRADGADSSLPVFVEDLSLMFTTASASRNGGLPFWSGMPGMRLLAAVIANSQSMISVKDLDGRYLLANEPLQRMLGVGEAELIGQTDRRVDLAERPEQPQSASQARQGAFHLEECFEVDGGLRYFKSVKFPLFDAEGRLYATCGIALDVTEPRHAALSVAEARNEAMAATAAKSAFLATMSPRSERR